MLLKVLLVTMTLAVCPVAAHAEALRAAASKGDLAAVEKLVTAKHPLDAKDAQGQTALLIAVAQGHTRVARALIDAGADINAVAANRDTPWLLAGARGRTDILRAMVPKGPDLSLRNRYGGSALIPACHYGHLETVKFLLTTKVKVDHVNDLGWTCLLEAVILGDGGNTYVEIIKAVLDAGADPNLADKNGVSPLSHAKSRSYKRIAELISARGGK
jgi:uncharacterized protein